MSIFSKIGKLRSIIFTRRNKIALTMKCRQSIAGLLIFSQFFQLSAAIAAPVGQPYVPSSQYQGTFPPTLAAPALNPAQDNKSSLSLSSEDLGLKGPLSLGTTYSDLTHAFFNARYVLPLSERLAVMGLGEYGADQYRLNGTVGYGFSPLSQIKFSAERLGQRLPFQFDSGDTDQNVYQDAAGVRFQKLFIQPFLQSLNAGAYYAKAANKDLAPVIFSSNGSNCNGYEAGLACINYRYLVGAASTGTDIGAEVLLTPSSLVAGNLYYDDVRYNTRFTNPSIYNRNGLGGSVRINQLLTSQFKLVGEASVRKIYNTYQGGVSWLLPGHSGIELSLFGQHLVSHNTTPDNNSVSLKFTWLPHSDRQYDQRFKWSSKQLTEVAQWVRKPAVYMEQVLVVSEQVTRLLGPAIIAINPNYGFFPGGNVVTITGSNFIEGLSVFIGSQLATAVTVVSPFTIIATIPGVTPPSSDTLTVDVTVQNPDGQKAVLNNGYTYGDVPSPTILSLNPIQGPDAGGTIVTINGTYLLNTTSVTFGGVPATNITPVNDTTVTATTSAHAIGLVDVVITTPTGSFTLPNSYTYLPTLASTNPGNVTRNVGQTASFATITSGGVPPYAYQWQVSTDGGSNFTDVTTGSGGTTATYITPALSLSDNNNQYRVVVTDAVANNTTTTAAILTVNTDLASTNPANATRNVGQIASFSTITSGGTTPYSYQWQVSTDGGNTFTDVTTGSGGTSASYNTAALALSDNNNQYRVLVTDAASDNVTTAAAILTVNPSLASTNPDNIARNVGQTASFSTITSGGTIPYTYQWQVSSDGGNTFTDVVTGSGGTTATYTTAALILANNNNRYRVIVTDSTGELVTTAAAILTVNTDLTSTNPANITRNVGQTASFSTITSGGTIPYTYQWQVSTNGGATFSNVSTGSGGTAATYTTAALALSDTNNRYRVVVTDAATDNVTTAAAILTVNPDLASTNPANVALNEGQTANFSTVTSGGTTPYNYQWQVSTDGGNTFTDVVTGSGGNSATYTTNGVTLSDNNNQYRVLVTDATSDSVTTAVAILTVNPTPTTTDPANITRNVGQTASFSTVTSGGTTPYTYQWQVSTNGGSTFSNVSTGSGGTTATYTTAALILANNNNRYRVRVIDATGYLMVTAAAILTVNPDLVSTNPADQSKVEGQVAGFDTVTSAGTPPYTYQWQVSSNGGATFSNLTDGTGFNTANYVTPSLTAGYDGFRYRVIVTDAAGDTVTTASALLTILSSFKHKQVEDEKGLSD